MLADDYADDELYVCEGGYRGCLGVGVLMDDPFDLEIRGVHVEVALCQVCCAERYDDI